MFPTIRRESEAERPRRAQSVPASAVRRYAKPPAAALFPPAACREFPKSRHGGRRYADFSDALHRFLRIPARRRLIRVEHSARGAILPGQLQGSIDG